MANKPPAPSTKGLDSRFRGNDGWGVEMTGVRDVINLNAIALLHLVAIGSSLG